MVAPSLDALATQLTVDRPARQPLVRRRLQALSGRITQRTGWRGAARTTAAEPLVTGRAQPYAESTLRKAARAMVRAGAVPIVERVLEAQVEDALATASSDARTLVYTDMFDQVFWSKRPTHAGPIGNRGNSILGATYFGMTFVQHGDGPPLAYHASWHKPATPLLDALQALHASDARATWLGRRADVHIWDRGGAGVPTLTWALAHAIPYLTVTSGALQWTEQAHPTLQTDRGVPVFVRPDIALTDWDCFDGAPVPREIVFPARPKKGTACTRAIRYKSVAALTVRDYAALDRLYKTRWPHNENAIKDLIAVGFDRNLDRTLTPNTSRGTDGQLARLAVRRATAVHEMEQLAALEPLDRARRARIETRRARLVRLDAERTTLAAKTDKATRACRGGEPLVKLMTMLVTNAIRLQLATSEVREVRTMSLAKVQSLLLSRSMITVVTDDGLTAYVAPVLDPRERELQRELVRLVDHGGFDLNGRRLRFALQPCTEARKSPRRRIATE